MLKVTIRVPALRGLFTIEGSPKGNTIFVAYGKSYEPFELEASSLGEAVDAFMRNTHRLRKTAEAEAMAKIRGAKIKKSREDNAKAVAGNIQSTKTEEPKPKEGEKGKRQTA